MVPLSAETGGRFDATFSKFLKEVVSSGLDFGESPIPIWTKEKRALFASRLCSAHLTTSYAMCYRTLHCKCPHLWVEVYRTVPRARGYRPSLHLRLSSMLKYGFHTMVKCRPCLYLNLSTVR